MYKQYLSLACLSVAITLSGNAYTNESEASISVDQAQYADKQGMRDAKRQPNWDRLADRLQIDDSRRDDFISVMEAQHQQRREIRENSGVREAMESLDGELQTTLAGILSAEELDNFNAHREKRKQRKAARHAEKFRQ